MRYKNTVCCVIFSGMLAIFALAGLAGASDIGATVKRACTTCHSAKRICLNLGVKSEAAWQATVQKMVAKGAQLSADQVGPAASYLAGLRQGGGPICP